MRQCGVTKPILVLYGIDPCNAGAALANDLAIAVVDAGSVQPLADAVAPAQLKVHLEVDAGMTRLGVRPEEVETAAAAIRDSPSLELQGFFAHFGNADDATTPFVDRQMLVFSDLVSMLESAGLRPPLVHLANSVGTLTRPDSHWDMVRPGVCLYGIVPASATGVQLRPVMTLESRVWRLWQVPVGRHVGYDQTFVTQRPTNIAVLPMGYADGYPRGLSNRGQVVVRGQRAPVIGRVCMDATMVDVTDIADVELGDPVLVWGGGDDLVHPVDDVARACDTIAYEVLARVGRRVPRIILAN